MMIFENSAQKNIEKKNNFSLYAGKYLLINVQYSCILYASSSRSYALTHTHTHFPNTKKVVSLIFDQFVENVHYNNNRIRCGLHIISLYKCYVGNDCMALLAAIAAW